MVKGETKAKSAADKAGKKDAPATTAAGAITHHEGRGRSKVREGVVVSDKMAKTIVVAVTRLEQHPIYKKYVHKTKKYYAHDEKEQASKGDLVRIVETRPLSKLKRWRVAEVVRKAEQGLELPSDETLAGKTA